MNAFTRPPDCGRDAAPYVLGALDPAEERAFVAHMDQCAVCRDEVAAFAPVLDALPASAPAYPAPRALRRRVLRVVRAEPKDTLLPRPRRITLRRSAPVGWLALGLALAAAAIVLFGGGQPGARVIRATVGRAELRVNGDHGELVVEHLAALPAGRTYETWLQSGDSAPVPSALFAVTAGGRARVGIAAGLRGVRRLLVTVEPRNGTLIPTTPAVIQVPLSYVRRS